MATLQPRWIWGLLELAWEQARQQLQERLAALARIFQLFQDNVEGRLQLLEAGGIVGRVDASGATTITLTTATVLTGLATTVVPSKTVSAVIHGVFDVSATAYPSGPASILVVELQVNGTPLGAQAIFAPAVVNERFTTAQVWVVPMAGGVSYFLQATGRVNLAGNTYRVAATHSGLVVELFG